MPAFFALFVALTCLGAVGLASAQPRPEDVQAAAQAFGEAQRAQLRGDYAQAADLFELADRSAPSAAALRSAIRNHRAAGQMARAATLAVRALERHSDDAETRALADEVLLAASSSLGRAEISCAPACSLAIDGRAVSATASERQVLYAEPGAHRLVASWPEREPVEHSLELAAGATRAIELVAPEPIAQPEPEPPPEPPASEPIHDAIARPAPPPPASRGLSPWIFGVGAGLTAVTTGLAIWSGIDTLDARDAYVGNPTREGYEDGVEREWRTTGLIIGAAALGIASFVIALFTDWDGDGEDSALIGAGPMPWLAPSDDGVMLGVRQQLGGWM